MPTATTPPTPAFPSALDPSSRSGGLDRRSLRRAAVPLGLAALPLALFASLGASALLPRDGYLALHALAEAASAALAFATFAVQWNAARLEGAESARARFLGIACLGAAALGGLHLLFYPGMPGFGAAGTADRALAAWLAGRGWMVLALLATVFVPPRSQSPWLRRGPLLLATLLASAALAAPALALRDGGALLSDGGHGLTGLSRAIETAIAAAAAGAAVLHARQFPGAGDRVAWLLVAALVAIALGETCFALRGSLFDGWSLLGHAYQVGTAWLVFGALFTAAVARPYRRLDDALGDLTASHLEVSGLRSRIEGELAVTVVRLEESTRREHRTLAELEAAIAAAPEGLVVYRPDGSILRQNAASERLHGFPEGVREWAFDARWRSLRPLATDGRPIPPERSPPMRALAGETVRGAVIVVHRPRRRPLWVSMSAAPIRAADGSLAGAVVSLSDVSLLQELQEQRADLLAVLSHDLRDGLQVILLQAERLMRLLPGPGPERKAADTAAAATHRMGVTIRDLVDSARLEMGILRLSAHPVPLRAFLQGLLATGLGAGAVDLAVPEELPVVRADPERLERVFQNLIASASRLSEPGGSLRVSASSAYGDVVIALAAPGLRLAPDELPKIFERSYGRTAGRKPEGLELYVARLLIEAHGGNIWAETVPGKGGSIVFTLPQAPSA